jgi:hypothetical protein
MFQYLLDPSLAESRVMRMGHGDSLSLDSTQRTNVTPALESGTS